MDFFYPNWINDFWRIQGTLFYSEPHYFEKTTEKKFDKEKIVSFCNEKGLAFFDTARKVCRLKDNANDNFLEILEPTDVAELLAKMPLCHTVVTTGGKASEELASLYHIETLPKPTENIGIMIGDRLVEWFRMPSSSRAYPLSLQKKSEAYRLLLDRL